MLMPSTANVSLPKHVTTPDLPPLLRLPLEIRWKIYRHCLVAQGPINPNLAAFKPPRYTTNEVNEVTIGLLLVNKQIESEAADVLHSENQWVVPIEYQSHGYEGTIPGKHLIKWRHVILYFDYLNYNETSRNELLRETHQPAHGSTGSGYTFETKVFERLEAEFYDQCFHASWAPERLRTLVLHLGNLDDYDRLGIMTNQLYHGLIRGLHRTRFHSLKVSDIEVTGLSIGPGYQEERDIVYGLWGFKEGVSVKASYVADGYDPNGDVTSEGCLSYKIWDRLFDRTGF